MRELHIKFIEDDIIKRGETLESDITFFASIYQCKVRAEGATRRKKVTYSAAKSVPNDWRKIQII